MIAQARALDKSGRRGPLIGVPFGIKDIIDSCDMPTEYGSPIYRGHQPKNDAACVALGRKAGGILMGKTVTTEFANQYPGKTRNPFDPDAHAGRLVERIGRGGRRLHGAARDRHADDRLDDPPGVVLRRVRLPADVRRPALHRREGGIGIARYVGTDRALGRRHRAVSRRAARRRAAAVACRQRAHCASVFAARIYGRIIEPHTQKLLEDAAQTLRKARRRRSGKSHCRRNSSASRTRIVGFRASSSRATSRGKSRTTGRASASACARPHQRRPCVHVREAISRRATSPSNAAPTSARSFGDCDVLLTASATGEAPVGTNSTGNVSPSAIWTTVHVPVMTMPVFKGPHGLPVGAQLIARRNDDRKLFAAAQWIYRQLT